MGAIELDPETHDRLVLVASALDKTEAETVAHLLDRLARSRPEERPRLPTGVEAIHAIYKGERVDAEFDRDTEAVAITSGPLAGTKYEKPSPAARAVVHRISSEVNPHRNGWSFWLVTATGETLQSIRKARR